MVDLATAEHHGVCPTCEGYGGRAYDEAIAFLRDAIGEPEDYGDDVRDNIERQHDALDGIVDLVEHLQDNLSRVQRHLQYETAQHRDTQEALAAADHVVDCYHRWSEDANDGTYALWREEDLPNSIIALRDALASVRARTPQEGEE